MGGQVSERVGRLAGERYSNGGRNNNPVMSAFWSGFYLGLERRGEVPVEGVGRGFSPGEGEGRGVDRRSFTYM